MHSKKIFNIISSFWNWIFLIVILVFLEVFARTIYGSTFLLNAFVIQSVLLFTAAPPITASGGIEVVITTS